MSHKSRSLLRGGGTLGGRHGALAVRILQTATTVLGILLVLTPLALWIAWSTEVLVIVLAIGMTAMLTLLLCRWLKDEMENDLAGPPGASPRLAPMDVSDQFLAELSGMGPFTYHNRLTGDHKFRMKMARLRILLSSN